MKTTIDIADALLEQARRQAQRQGTTVRALVERGLRTVLAEDAGAPPFKLRKVVFSGQGLSADLSSQDWGHLRELAYEGRGT